MPANRSNRVEKAAPNRPKSGMNAKQRRAQLGREKRAATGTHPTSPSTRAHAADQARRLRDGLRKQENRWIRWKLSTDDVESRDARYMIIFLEYLANRDTLPFPEEVKDKLDDVFNWTPDFSASSQRLEEERAQARLAAGKKPGEMVYDWFPAPKSKPWTKDLTWWMAVAAAFDTGDEEVGFASYAPGDEGYVAGSGEDGVEEDGDDEDEAMEVDEEESGDAVLDGDLAAVLAEIKRLRVHQ